MKKFLLPLLTLAMMLGIATSFASPALADNAFKEACRKTPNSVVCKQTTGAKGATNTFIQQIISILLFVIGAISVIVIIIGGIRYVTSDGESSKVQSAKNTILYAIVGLVVALLAYAIVNFVLSYFT